MSSFSSSLFFYIYQVLHVHFYALTSKEICVCVGGGVYIPLYCGFVTVFNPNISAFLPRYLKAEHVFLCTQACDPDPLHSNWSLNPLQSCCLYMKRYFQPLSAKPCNIKQYLSISDSASKTQWWWDSFSRRRLQKWAIKHRTGMKTSGPCNMETVLLHLTATVFDRGIKCVVSEFMRECVGSAVFMCRSVRW